MATACRVAYQPGISWATPAAGVIGLLVTAVAAYWNDGRERRAWALFSGFWFLWVLVAVPIVVTQYADAKRELEASTTRAVSGVVRTFTPGELVGRKTESFEVNGVPFFYQYEIITGGFRRTMAHGGPVREGLQVRIWYDGEPGQLVGNRILKLEICP